MGRGSAGPHLWVWKARCTRPRQEAVPPTAVRVEFARTREQVSLMGARNEVYTDCGQLRVLSSE